MKRSTVFMDESLERDIQAIAREEKRPVASLIREALAQYVANRNVAARIEPAFVAAGRSGRSDVAERHEDLLWDKAAKRKRAPRPSRPAPRRKAR
jgi:predicted transcriptional regulator